jgi:uncharacterized protein (TIGR00255 family)
MIRSMTGFGEADREIEGGRLRVEIKTVNHRFLNTSVRTPPGFDRVEHEIQQWIRPFLARGHATVAVILERDDAAGGEDDLPVLDLARARRFAELLGRLRDEVGLAGEVDVGSVVRLGDVLRAPDGRDRQTSVDADVLREVVESAAKAVVDMRSAEGARLRDDMEGRLTALGAELERVAERAPGRLVAERDRLRAQVAELAGGEDVDEDRLAREIAYLAERWDINEELVRFRAHLDAFREALGGEADPVGKRLSFLVQEMHREANTIGSKANDVAIGHASVAMKEEIERLREQVENVE